MSCGEFVPDSRLAKLIAVLLGVVNPKLYVPFPVIEAVTSMLIHTPAPNEPEEPSTLPTGGALL